MDRKVTTIIDLELCIGCGLCADVCPSGTISMIGNKAAVSGNQSLGCGHCAAICPVGAVRVTALENKALAFKSFTEDQTWLPFGEYDTAQLLRLMRSRRSCRNYKDKSVDRSLLEDLVKIGITAPSGTNSQKWTFTILPERKDVAALGDKIADFFKSLNRLAEKPLLRRFLSFAGKKELEYYYREYYESVKQALEEYQNSGKDILFHGAAAALIIAAKPGGSCPAEDSLLAAQNILLGAHSMGLGTCLIGFAVEAMKNDGKIKKFAGIPDEERVYAVIAVGYPDETYQRLTGRKDFVMRYFKA